MMVPPVRQADPFEPALGDRLCLSGAHPAHLGQPEHHVLQRREVREEVVALEHHSDACALMRQFPSGQPLSFAAAVDLVA